MRIPTPSTRLLAWSLAAAAALAALPPAGLADSAALSPLYVEWADGPAQLLFTRADRQRWSELSSDAEAEDFIRLFWARRDPLPETSDNELQREFERRVAFADQEFAETAPGGETVRGSLTDRGRVLILLGPPQRRQRGGARGAATGGDFGVVEDRRGLESGERSVTGDGSGSGLSSRGGNVERFGAAENEVWVYEDEALPNLAAGARLDVVFRSEPGHDRVELLDSPRLGGFLLQAVEGALVRPDLTLADLGSGSGEIQGEGGYGLYGATPLAAGAPELAALRTAAEGEGAGSEGATAVAPAVAPAGPDAHLSAAVFRASDGTWVVPVQVSRADGLAGPARPVIGELTDAAGASALAFKIHPGAPDADGRRFARATLIAPPGDYQLAVGVLGEDGTVAWRDRTPISIPVTRHELWLSDVVLSGRVFALQRPQEMLEPWTWQGVMVVPEGDRAFRQGEMLWYYLHVCRPQLDEQSRPHIQVALDLDGALSTSGRVRIDPFQVGDDCWVLAQAYDLVPDRFPAGDYRLGITVRDTLAEQTVVAEPVSFTVLPAQDG